MKNFLKKTCFSIIILSLIFSTTVFAFPQKAKAQFAVIDASNLVVNTLTSINTGLTASQTVSMNIQNSILNTIATLLTKALIRTITASVVNWINTGFEGSPSFVQNPGSFFLDTADQATGEFLAKSGGPLTELCSPFSIDIRLALAFKYHPRIHQKYSCTLGAIINNTKNAAENATINGRSIAGFMSGDFSQGGLPAFISLTTEPQNNIYGAYLTADSDLSFRVASARLEKRDEISNGQGFLSWRNPKCKADIKAHNSRVTNNYNTSRDDVQKFESETGTGEGYYSGEVGELKSVNSCPIETPGSLVVDSLRENIAGPLRELGLVDSINEIVGALAAQLVNTVLQGGLTAISGASASDTTAYINQIQAEADTEHAAAVKSDFVRSVERFVGDAFEYKKNKDKSVQIMVDVKETYERARACYVQKSTTAYSGAYQSKISEIDSKINSTVVPLINVLKFGSDKALNKFADIANLRDEAQTAKTIAEIDVPTKKFTRMLQNNELITSNDVQESKREIDQTTATAQPLKRDADMNLAQCQYGGATY